MLVAFIGCQTSVVRIRMHERWRMKGEKYEVLIGDIFDKISEIPDNYARCCITSVPYWAQRDYGDSRQIGVEKTPQEYVSHLCDAFDLLNHKVTDTLWVNIGDTYSRQGGAKRQPRHWDGRENGPQSLKDIVQSGKIGIAPKSMIGIPWMFAFEMRNRGWIIRQEYPWIKTNPTPDPVDDRPANNLERFFLFSRNDKYLFNIEAAKAYDGKTVWRNSDGLLFFISSVASNKSFGHASFPVELISPMILASSNPEDAVIDPFSGAATTGIAALRHNRKYIGIELIENEARKSLDRLSQESMVQSQQVMF